MRGPMKDSAATRHLAKRPVVSASWPALVDGTTWNVTDDRPDDVPITEAEIVRCNFSCE